MGFLLHPLAQDHLESITEAKIAEFACGTGIWLIDVAKLLPHTTTLDGYDIGAEKFPTDGSLPSNVHLHVSDVINEPVSQHLRAVYDFIHIRYFTIALARPDWKTVAEKAFQMLKPGGVLQWTELDISMAGLMLRAGPVQRDHAPMHRKVFASPAMKGLVDTTNGIPLLPVVLPEVGFEVLTTDIVSADRFPEAREGKSREAARAWMDMITFHAKSQSGDSSGLSDVQKGMQKEVDEGYYAQFHTWTFVAKKPETRA